MWSCLLCCLKLFVFALRCAYTAKSIVFAVEMIQYNATTSYSYLLWFGSFSSKIDWLLLLRFGSFSNINVALSKFPHQRFLRCCCICRRITRKEHRTTIRCSQTSHDLTEERKPMPSYWSQRKKGWSTGKLVGPYIELLQIRQLAQFSRNATWGIQNPVNTYKNQVTLSYWYDFTEERKPMPSYWRQVRGKKDGVPVSLL
jgi:hypothetical protein